MERKIIGIIGGGQLGRMLIQAGINYPIEFHVYSNSEDFASKGICRQYTVGDLNDYQKIIEFGKKCDIITIEIENVNVDALKYLKSELSKTVYPQPEIIELIKDRGHQKEFLKKLGNDICTLDFIHYENIFDLQYQLKNMTIKPPFVNKLNVGGYDGYGTKIIKDENFMNEVFKESSIIEEYCEIDRELSVMVGRNINGDIVIYPTVEMKFNDQNMLDHLTCYAAHVEPYINHIATHIAQSLNLIGIMAIELFQSKGKIYVNEMAPRPHNSGHHTQDMFNYSQFDILIKCLLDMPLPSLEAWNNYGASINLLGSKDQNGSAIYNRLNKLGETFIHIYDKGDTKPYRKMGHLNVVCNDYNDLMLKIENVKTIIHDSITAATVKKVASIPRVGVIMGSKSDYNIMSAAIEVLKEFKIPYEVKIVSAHRTPEMMIEYGKTACERGLEAIIAGAGGAAHLPGMIASCTSLPVIGVPIKSSNSIDGWDSILSILQMPNGVPVGTVNLNGAQNAGLLVVRMLGDNYKMDDYRQKLKKRVDDMNKELNFL